MNNLKITAKDLKNIVEDINLKIIHNHMSNLTIINSSDIFVSFSCYRNEKLLISLNPNSPFISLIKIDKPCGTKISIMNDVLRKEVKDGFINGLETLNSDRIVAIHFHKTNDYFERENKTLIIELIPHRPNLILINEEEKIMYASHYTDASSSRIIMKGIKYTLPSHEDLDVKSTFDYESYKVAATDYYLFAINKRLEEQYKPVITHIKSRIKTLKQKILVLDREIEDAKNKLAYQEIGSMILTYTNDREELNKYLQENNVAYDDTLTPGVNANKYFIKYKKAKRTIEMDQIEQGKTIEEINKLEATLRRFEFLNEEEIAELASELFPHKFKQNTKKLIETKPTDITYNGTKISFGKNAKQNDMLTFRKSNKDDVFFHVKDSKGAHVVVHNQMPDNDTILLACEIALLLSGKESGEVQSAIIKNVKKGSFLGQALLTSYQSYVITNIREETKRLLMNHR